MAALIGDGSGAPPIMQHSRCVQLECDTVKDAVSTFSAASMDAGPQGRGEIPLVLIPRHRSFFSANGWWMTIPTGCYCLLQKWGQDNGIAAPGGAIRPPWWRISYVVTQQSCTYNAPVKECPTSDNVRVSVDLVIVFMIRDPQAFVYKLGAVRFDQLLSGAVDEGIRILVRSLSHHHVYSLRGSKADAILTHLNDKFEGTGVVFNNCTITAVSLPQELRQSLERTTEMRKLMEKTKRQQEFDIGQIKRDSEESLLEVKRKNENIIVSEMGRKKRASLEHEEKLVNASQERQTMRYKCEEQTKVQLAEARALLQITEKKVEQMRVEMISKAESEAQASSDKAHVEYEKTTLNAEAEMKRLQNDAQAIKLDADAERQTSAHLAQKRKFELDIREKDILNKLASKGNFNLIGAPGDTMVNAVMSGNFTGARGSNQQWFG